MKKFFKWVLIIIVAIIVLAVVFGNKDKSNNSSNSSESSQQAVQQPPIKVSAKELAKAYKDNEVGANKKYKDHNLLVTGTIDAIHANISDKAVVVFKIGSYEFNSPQASITDEDQDKASNLKKGSTLTVLCSNVDVIMGSAMLQKCKIQ